MIALSNDKFLEGQRLFMHIATIQIWRWPIVSCALFLLITLGCGGPQPSAPGPKAGYRTDPISYEPKPQPLSPLVSLGEFELEDGKTAVPSPQNLPILERDHFMAVEGVAIHPDPSITEDSILLQLVAPSKTKTGEYDVINESAVNARGEKGKLTFRIEVRVPKNCPQECILKVFYMGVPPGFKVGDTPRVWRVPIVDTVLKVAKS